MNRQWAHPSGRFALGRAGHVVSNKQEERNVASASMDYISRHAKPKAAQTTPMWKMIHCILCLKSSSAHGQWEPSMG